jgi:hypothetical protein
MTIDITDFVDSRMTAPQPWQRILVRAEKGKILNGYEKTGWHIFEAGSGSVTVQYKSPQTCEDEQEEIQVKTDSPTGKTKVTYVSVPFFDVEFLIDEHVEYKGKKEGTDRQLVPNNSSSSRNFTFNFTVQPTVVKDKEACFKVTGGDGVRVMSGRCTETFPQPGDDLQRTTREIYEWQVSRR